MSQTWAEKNRQRHVLRQIIKGKETLEHVLMLANKLEQLGDEHGIEAARVGAYKAAADIKLRVLDKVLPDLKSVEHELGEGLSALNEDELLERVRQLHAALDPRVVERIHAADTGDAETIQ